MKIIIIIVVIVIVIIKNICENDKKERTTQNHTI